MADFLFDIGKVLLDFDFETSLTNLLPEGHSDPAGSLARLLARKDEFEAGQITVDDYTAWAIGIFSTEVTPRQFHEAWRNIFTPNIPMWETARKLRADGHRLLLFSNTNAIHCPWLFDAYAEFSLFHGSVLSYETGFIKPHPEIYRHAINRFSLIPEKTIYIDDLPANIATGNQFGLLTYHYDLHDHASFAQSLSEHLSSTKH